VATRDEIIRQDSEDLKRLGYAQQLLREMRGFSNFAVSFSIISVLTGGILLFGYGLKLAGPDSAMRIEAGGSLSHICAEAS